MAVTVGATGGAVGGAVEEDEAAGGADDEAEDVPGGPEGPPEPGTLPVDEVVAIVERDREVYGLSN